MDPPTLPFPPETEGWGFVLRRRKAMLITINPKNPQKRLIGKVVDVLVQGGMIGYPTDTIYGVGCDLFNP